MFDDGDDGCDVEINVCLHTFLGHTSSAAQVVTEKCTCIVDENVWRARAHTPKVKNENKECVIFIYTRKEKRSLSAPDDHPPFSSFPNCSRRRQNLVGGGAFFVETC